MKRTSLLKFTLLLFTVLLSNSSLAEDFTKWALPDGAKSRSGKGWPYEIAYSPDGNLLAVAGTIGIWVYDVGTGTEIELLTDHSDSVDSVAFSPDGVRLASGSGTHSIGGGKNTIRLRDVQDGSHLRTLKGHKNLINSVPFSPNGSILASGSGNNLVGPKDNTVGLWDVRSGKHLPTFKGHTGEIRSLDFSPDGLTLAGGGWDGSVPLWDLTRDSEVIEAVQ